jgi:hypothetical protein
VQVSFAILLAVAFGYLSPTHAIAMKPLGDAFIRLITMIITVMIFCTVVTGIAGMQDLRKVGRVGGKRCSILRSSRRWRWLSDWCGQRGAPGQRLQCQRGHARRTRGRRLCRTGKGADRH